MKANKYVCECGKDNTKRVKAMMQAGFEVWHIACKECGRNAIRVKQQPRASGSGRKAEVKEVKE